MLKNKLLILAIIVVAFTAVFFYLNNSKIIDLKGNIESPGLINKIADYDKEKNKAEEALNNLSLAVNDFEKLRVPEESYGDEFSAIKQLFNRENYTETVLQSIQLGKDIRAVIEAENVKPKISITFDAGAGSGATQKLIDYLASSRLKITFFSTGKWTEQNPELFKNVLVPRDGLINELGNHTYSHAHLVSGGLTDEQSKEEIIKTENFFSSFGYTAKPLFRDPYGERNVHTNDLINELGYDSVYWTVDSLGWQNKQTGEEIAQRVISKLGSNGIVLMHVGSNEDVEAVPIIVEKLKAQYRFVFASEL